MKRDITSKQFLLQFSSQFQQDLVSHNTI